MPPNPLAMYVSSGQRFTQRGRAGRTGVTYARDVIEEFEGAIEDMAALNSRLLVLNRDTAVRLAEALTRNTKAAIQRHMPPAGWRPRENTGEPFEFSKGRLAAAWGQYTPEMMRGRVDDNDQVPIEVKHEAWATDNGVAGDGSIIEGRDIGEEREVNMGAITDIKRVKGNVWTAEVGTFLPYAALANDGGTMRIQPYGNPRAEPVDAVWEGVHFMEEGISLTEAEVQEIIETSINEALQGQTTRRRVRNPNRRNRG
jgi:hypothetical protein